jgi:hypothetical protein
VTELKVSLFADAVDIVLFGKGALFNTPVMGQVKSPGREFAKIRKGTVVFSEKAIDYQ